MSARPPSVTSEPTATASVIRSSNHQSASTLARSGYPAVEIVMARDRPMYFVLSKNAVSPIPSAVRTLIIRQAQARALTWASDRGFPNARATGTRSTLPPADRITLSAKLGKRV